ncbi:MAG: hypothetical protein AAFV72_00205 [Cyanobacteria bacterium J06635_1]
MVAISEQTATFPLEITRVETTDVALGGNEVNVPNKQFKQIADRTAFLKAKVDNLTDASAQAVDTISVASIAQGRLGVVSGDAIGLGTSSSFYYTPYKGDYIGIYDNTAGKWVARQFSEISQDISGLGAPAVFDVFARWNGAAVVMDRDPWASSGAGSSSRGYSMTQRNGVWVRSSDNARYLGSFCTFTAGQVEISDTSVGVWNVDNQVLRNCFSIDESTYSYNNAAFRFSNNNAGSRVNVVNGLPGQIITVSARVIVEVNPGSTYIAIAENNNFNTNSQGQLRGGGIGTVISQRGFDVPIGRNFYQLIESAVSGSSTFTNPITDVLYPS